MKKLYMVLMTLLSCSVNPIWGQVLHVGDTLPNVIVENIHGYNNQNRLHFSEFKGKLIILDFWDTWCNSCIILLTHLDSLQKQFPNKVRIIAVTDQSHDLITNFLTKNKIAGQLSLTFITDDTLLKQWFPHQVVPHEVWVSPTGTVQSITPAQEVTEEHIRKMLQKHQLEMLQKEDHPYREPLFSADYLPKNKLLHYAILLKGYLPGTNKSYLHSNIGQLISYGTINRPLLDLYMDVARHYIRHFSRRRVLFEIKDPSPIDYTRNYYKDFAWVKKNLYSYEIVLPKKDEDSLFAYMFQDLNRYSNYHGRFETREQPCLILKANPEKKITAYPGSQTELPSSDTSNLYGFTAETVIPWLMSLKYLKLPIIQETGYSDKLFIDSWHKPSDRTALNKMLANYGLVLTEGHRPLPMLIISDKK